MTTQELAIKYGVPMPDTCKELNWQGGTLFYWVKNNEDEFIIVQKEDIDYWVVDSDDICISAPQMHEIARRIGYADGYITIKEDILMTDWLSVEINDFHFAQAAAELYLKLKKKGLLA